jgi:hypothetical protein
MVADPVVSLPHPLLSGVAALEDALGTMPVDGWAGLEPALVPPLLERMMRVGARLQAHQMAAARVVDKAGVAKQRGATSTGALLAGGFGGDRRAGDRMVRAAKALETATQTEDALAEGRITSDQAKVIADAVNDLPADTTPEEKQACEDTLIGDAGTYSLKDLRSRAARITDQFKPADEVDDDENEKLERREKAAWGSAEFSMWDNRDGTHSGRFRVPSAHAEMLEAAVNGISAPRRDHLHDHPGAVTDEGESVYDRDLDRRHRLGMGFAELCGHLPTDRLPSGGGVGLSLVARFDYDTLVKGVRPATLSTGTRMTAGEVRLAACRVGLIPQVFGGAPLPLDHGAEQRLFTRAQRLAMENRDGGCTFPDCDRPPQWCEGHHAVVPWSIGQTTMLREGVLLCAFHHRTVHGGWAVRFSPDDGFPQYRAPGSDTWRRNHRWRP